jgi:hypothetical protein
VFHKRHDLDDDGLLHLVAHYPTRFGLDLGNHLFLLVAFGQNRSDPGNLTLGLAQACRVFRLPRREAEP